MSRFQDIQVLEPFPSVPVTVRRDAMDVPVPLRGRKEIACAPRAGRVRFSCPAGAILFRIRPESPEFTPILPFFVLRGKPVPYYNKTMVVNHGQAENRKAGWSTDPSGDWRRAPWRGRPSGPVFAVGTCGDG